MEAGEGHGKVGDAGDDKRNVHAPHHALDSGGVGQRCLDLQGNVVAAVLWGAVCRMKTALRGARHAGQGLAAASRPAACMLTARMTGPCPQLTANIMVLRALKTLNTPCTGDCPTKGAYTTSGNGLYMAASTVAMVQ